MDDIYECAGRAVAGANQLIAEPRNQFPFELKRTGHKFEVSGWPIGPTVTEETYRVVCFDMDAGNGRILVKAVEGAKDFRVFQRWNVKDEKCSIYVETDGEEPCDYTADQIAQLALELLFFV